MTKDEALKLALEALLHVYHEDEAHPKTLQAINAIKQALAQPQQEPVLWMMPDGKTVDKWGLQFYSGDVGTPLYTTPPQRTWVGLTDEEISKVLGSDIHDEPSGELRFIRAIEAKLKEKNNA